MPAGKIIQYINTAVIKWSVNVCGQPQFLWF